MDYEELNRHLEQKAKLRHGNTKSKWFSKNAPKLFLSLAGGMMVVGLMKPFFSKVRVPVPAPGTEAPTASGSPSASATAAEIPKPTTVPADFDWRYYLKMNPDLGQNAIRTEEAAKTHWVDFGYRENRVYFRKK